MITKTLTRRNRTALAVTSGALALAVTAGVGLPAVAAPPADSPSRSENNNGAGRGAQQDAREKALGNGSGRKTTVAPVNGAWMNTRLSSDRRADLLLAQMTLEEKVSRLHGEFSGETAFYIAPLERLGIPALLLTDAGAGVRVTNQDTNDGRATALPAPLALGATWDTSLAAKYGDILGAETRASGQNGLLGPTGDLVRDAR